MRIVIIGAGKVGLSIVENFIAEESDIVVVDSSKSQLDIISAKYDLMTVVGNACDVSTLERAGLSSASLLIAASGDDNVNILVCKIAHDLFHVQNKFARIRSSHYLEHREELFTEDLFPIDFIIEPTDIMARSLYNLVRHPGCETFTYFGDDKQAVLYSCQAQYGGTFIGRISQECLRDLAKVDISLVTIIRNGAPIQISDSSVISAGDTIVLCSAPSRVQHGLSHFQRLLQPPKRVMIAGGSQVGFHLAKMLAATGTKVKIIERDQERADELSSELSNCLIIQGDCSNEDLLFNERIDATDLFIATTDSDNLNVITGVLAKRLQARRVISMISKNFRRNLLENSQIDLLYSGENDIATELRTHSHLTYFERQVKDVQGMYQVVQFAVEEHLENYKIAGSTYSQLKLPSSIHFLGIIRDDDYIVVEPNTEFAVGDRVLAFGYGDEVDDFERITAKSADYV